MRGGIVRHRWLGLVFVGLMGLAGCSGADSDRGSPAGDAATGPAASAPTGPAGGGVTTDDGSGVAAILADYDRRNAEALAAASDDPAAWATANTGGLLESLVFVSELDEVGHDHAEGDSHGHEGVEDLMHEGAVGYLPAAPKGDEWILVATSRMGQPALISFSRAEADGPWLAEATVALESKPTAPAEQGSASTADEMQLQKVWAAATSVIDNLGTPTQSPVEFTGPLVDFSTAMAAESQEMGAGSFAATADFYGAEASGQGSPGSSMRVVVTADGGLLAVVWLRASAVFTARPGSSLELPPDIAQVTGVKGPQPQVRYDFLATVGLQVGVDDQVTMLGSSIGNLPAPR